MLRISDIFKKHREQKKNLDTDFEINSGVLGSAYRVPPQGTGGSADQNQVPQAQQVSISAAVHKELNSINATKASELYDHLVSASRVLYNPDLKYEEGFLASLSPLVEKTIGLLQGGNKNLLRCCLIDYPQATDYFYYHTVNVCVISLELGIGLRFDQAGLMELGVAALTHDIGMVKCFDIINKPDVLRLEETKRIKEHPLAGLEIVQKFGREFGQRVFDVVRQEHERMDGAGYPAGLKEDQICEYARIVGLVDVYEAMNHKRPYRLKFSPLETIKTILKNKSFFDHKIIKLLIERIGVFPLGTLVRLNTKEIGLVVRENLDLPLRPVVNIIIDAYGKELKEPKQVNLADNSMIYVDECLNNQV
ncbi:MAG: HD domain-containing phosphohydrolase [Candidatus Omnitrophota bacterium]|jgi:HD-GYP domain-containing protein (c-di-GMP phosphodiesterase class II)